MRLRLMIFRPVEERRNENNKNIKSLFNSFGGGRRELSEHLVGKSRRKIKHRDFDCKF